MDGATGPESTKPGLMLCVDFCVMSLVSAQC